jgi:Spy/CpxP family protein refolding chaperone
MKTLIIGVGVVSILAFGALAFAQGMGGQGGGHMGGYGMTGSGYGGGHMGTANAGQMGDRTSPGYGTNQTDQKFLDETADLRKELHEKRYEYAEAVRNPDTKRSTIRELEKEIYELEDKIYEKSPQTNRGYSAY